MINFQSNSSNMHALSILEPAELLFLFNPRRSNLDELLQFTLIDLIMKQVVELKTVRKKLNKRDPRARNYSYVIQGKNFKGYNVKKHEEPFISILKKRPKNGALEVTYLASLAEIYESDFKNMLKNSEVVHIFNSPESNFTLSSQMLLPHTSINQIKEHLDSLDKNITELISKNKTQFLFQLLNLGSNIFLLKNLDKRNLKSYLRNVQFKDIQKCLQQNPTNVDIRCSLGFLNPKIIKMCYHVKEHFTGISQVQIFVEREEYDY